MVAETQRMQHESLMHDVKNLLNDNEQQRSKALHSELTREIEDKMQLM